MWAGRMWAGLTCRLRSAGGGRPGRVGVAVAATQRGGGDVEHQGEVLPAELACLSGGGDGLGHACLHQAGQAGQHVQFGEFVRVADLGELADDLVGQPGELAVADRGDVAGSMLSTLN